ncbi:zinc finger protein ZFAT isoform X3 [Tympanuchus pallidicinctus]|uniref:zinc finger protein ZFAT isoform X3 n=1 Tax=Tympanuchus pallidicinctus TaxID=109042 RepID=UPI002287315A|nr:zinc finger protein ZFAT isoform X3 [Tympanuchus pallidicinctus]
MEAAAAGISSIFMCKLCNLFSPNQSELLSHVSAKHSEEGTNVDDIIIPLQPLTAPADINRNGEEFLSVKKKRGRPKGSTKKLCGDEDVAENNSVLNEEAQPGTEVVPEVAEVSPGSLECRRCNRKFSNTRQLRKHICIIVLNEGEEEGDGGNDSDVDLDRKEDEREKTPKRPRVQKTEKTPSTKETEQVPGAKNPIISVVLTAHEAIPGATKIVPVEAAPQESEPSTPETVVQDPSQRRGYQEYAIQQTPYEQTMKSIRLGPTQLKIFTCEYCNKVFKFKHSLQAHLRIHTNEKPYKCSYCNYASAIKANLNVHLRKHTGEKFSCDCCTFTCLSKGHLKVHIERVHKKIKQHCRFCKKKYSDVKNLIKHIKETHDLQDKKVKDVFDELRLMTREGKRQLLYDCHICERKFKNELDRDRHMLVHGDERPFACELCGHGATKYQALELHVRKHPFVYVCSVCLMKFVSSVRLRAHIREVHADLQETSVFNSSINQSFCLLEPGGDIQPEALGEQLSQTADELTMMSTDAVTTPSTCTDESIAADVNHNDQHNGDLKTNSVSSLECENPLVENVGETVCEASAEAAVTNIQSCVMSDCFLLKNGTSAPDELKDSAANGEESDHCSSVNERGEEIQLLLSEDASLNDKKSYSCPVCEKSFSEDRLIKSHIKINHPEVSMSTISEILGRRVQLKGLIGKRAVKCPYCDFYFMKNGSDLQRHIWAHEGVKPFKCSLCEYAARSKSNLKAHMNRHSTEKTHLCDMCGKKFKSKSTLKSHKLLHTADGKQFKCTVCDYTAVQKPQLLRHMEQHVPFKPFRCAHCRYSCNISGSLKRHYNKKHPNEEYVNVGSGEPAAEALIQQGGIKCPVCSFVYGTKWEFNRHLKNKHGMKLVEHDGEAKWELTAEVSEEASTQYLHITEAGEDDQGTQAAVAALQNLRYTSENGERLDPTAVNILQQIIELGSETHDATAVASVVTMAPGTVTVVKQVKEEEQSANHTLMIQETLQQASVELSEQHHLVVSSDEVEGIETVTVYTQGGEASEFIVYVQEAMQSVEEQTVEQSVQEL